MFKKTPLHQQHLNAHAKMIDFHHWSMPLHYGSQLEEHRVVRANAGVFDVSHMTIIDLTGKQVPAFLRYLLANNIDKLQTPGKALYSCMLNDQGGVIDDLIAYYQTPEQYRLVTNAATRQRDVAWIRQHAESFNVNVNVRSDLAMLAVQGPKARQLAQSALPAGLRQAAMALPSFSACWNEHWFVSRTGYTGEDGFEILLPATEAADCWQHLLTAGVSPAGLGARDTLRIEAGLSLYGADMDETVTPLASGLAWTVAFEPMARDFIGRDTLIQQQTHGNHPILIGLVLRGKGVLRAHQPVTLLDGREGVVTSGTFSPILNRSIGFARLPQGNYEGITVTIRNRQLAAQVVKYPFVKQGKICVQIDN
ncbi:glycine cleavage system aminomethyltransferase GcvT [Thioflexithrix psekupsensis]|uniref:Aminomethyltransferase n=1 Tax=Thioflexithrix psekupsensis TaxID=1570016 RepID=A0A251XCS4_9GAMM|nr:glycine cleavage system aminomethyltransferase GcvT [Thioflexithrix psekupsensis]OUD16175.1 glycine cleavage system protein T [Thioflexithrix psekupsensis]